MKKYLAMLLALAMVFSLCACGSTETATPAAETAAPAAEEAAEPEAEETAAEETEEPAYTVYERTGDYDADSSAIYEATLGEFCELLTEAAECTDVNERYVKMAIAEAKLLESAVFVPGTSQGGNYGLRRTAPYTAATVNWGSDMDRYHNVVVTEELINKEDYAALKALWAELRGTGTYEQAAKDYLTENGYTLKDSYTYAYNSDPTTWDVFTTFLAADWEAIINTYDGLMEYDCENVLQPALAESYEVSEDGMTYTFHLREGLKWVDSQGREIADLTADDFVAGMQHFLEGGSGAEYLAGAEGACVLNADEYSSAEITDFSQVGVKALDDYTVEYTLSTPCTYFLTLMGTNAFAPLCRSYFLSVGGGFGADYDTATCQYGIDADHIAYCGPYLVTSATAENSIVFKANPSYWNADNINNKTITWLFNDGQDPTKGYEDCISGTTDTTGLRESAIEIAKTDGVFDEYAIVSGVDATAFVTYYNLNRNAYANYNDETVAVSAKTDEEKEVSYAAFNNQHFRLALSYGLDRANINAQVVGDELSTNNLVNSYCSGTFVALDADTTAEINGESVTFPAGTWYGEIIQAQIDADGYPMLVFDTEADNGIGSGAGYDGWYNVDNAVAELEIAVAELAEAGIEISAENPVVIDYPYPSNDESYTNKANAYKQCIEKNLNGYVQVNLVECSSYAEWYYTQYYCYTGEDMNFDIGDLSGWSADYGDPYTYLATMLPDYVGYCCSSIGLF